jgi:putative peptide zinc metalloprotease protein
LGDLKPDAAAPAAEAPRGATADPKRKVFALRSDLEVTEQTQRGHHYAIIKDPVSLAYYRLAWSDYELALLLRGAEDVEGWIRKWTEKFPSLAGQPREKLLAKARALIGNLEMKQLCVLPGQGAVSYSRSRENQKKKTRPLRWMTSWLMLRKSVYDPDALLTRLEPKLRFIFSRWFTGLWLLLMAGAVAILVTHTKDMSFDPAWFFSLGNLVLLYVCFVGLKIVHEFGHGLTCKHYGGEVHEVGMMMMAFHPMFYVNVSDAWLLPKKSQRIAVSAAGVYVELIFACLLSYVWVLLAPGFLKDFTFNAILVASVTTIFFNTNPLMKFDGYYILSDWLEIPNLRERSLKFVSGKFRRLFFGKDPEAEAKTPETLRQSRALAIYAVLSFLYLVFVMWNVLHTLDHLFDKVGLRFVGHLLVLSWFAASIGFPIWMFFSRPQREAVKSTGRRRLRPLVVSAILVLLLTGVLCLPWHKTVSRACIFELANPYQVRAEQAGFVTAVLRKEGDLVEANEVVAQLRNPELEMLLATQEEAIREVETKLNVAQNEDKVQHYETFRRQKSGLLAGLEEIQAKIDQLQLRSAKKGRVLTRNLQDQMGRYLKPGDTYCSVGPEGDLEVLIPLSEREARFVKTGDPARLRLTGLPEETFTGRITQKPLTTISGELPAALTSRRGGDVASTVDSSGDEQLLEKQWYAVLRIDEQSNLLRPGMTGRVQVDCGGSSLGSLLGQKVLDFVNLDYRL